MVGKYPVELIAASSYCKNTLLLRHLSVNCWTNKLTCCNSQSILCILVRYGLFYRAYYWPGPLWGASLHCIIIYNHSDLFFCCSSLFSKHFFLCFLTSFSVSKMLWQVLHLIQLFVCFFIFSKSVNYSQQFCKASYGWSLWEMLNTDFCMSFIKFL